MYFKPSYLPQNGAANILVKSLAEDLGIDEAGYRLNFNCNQAGGQTVYHIHLHLMGGREFGWPPG